MTVQLCPKCQGQGVVSRPPWLPAGVPSWSSSTLFHRCNLCDGRMVIDSPERSACWCGMGDCPDLVAPDAATSRDRETDRKAEG